MSKEISKHLIFKNYKTLTENNAFVNVYFDTIKFKNFIYNGYFPTTSYLPFVKNQNSSIDLGKINFKQALRLSKLHKKEIVSSKIFILL